MDLYIEYAIADNLLIDFLLLKESAATLKIRTRFIFVALSAMIGTAFAVCFPLLNIGGVFSFLLKIACGALMCFIAAKHRSVKGYLLYFNVFLLATFILGGASMGILNLLGISDLEKAYSQTEVLPVGVPIFASYLIFLIVKKYARRVADSALTVCGLIDCELVIRGVVFKMKAFFDSGNFLTDRRTRLPVIVADKTAFNKISSRVFIVKYGEVFVNSAGSRFSLDTYRVDYVKIKTKQGTFVKDAVLAASLRPSGIAGAELIIGKELIGGAVC